MTRQNPTTRTLGSSPRDAQDMGRHKLSFVGVNAVVLTFVLFGLINLFDSTLAVMGQKWMALAVGMSPFQYFLAAPGKIIQNWIGHTLVPVAFVYLLGRSSRWLLAISFCVVLMLEAVTFYVGRAFQASLASEWVELLMNTSLQEVGEFVKMALTVRTLIGIVFLIGALFFAGRLFVKAFYPKISIFNFFKGLVLLLPFVVLNCLLQNWHYGVNQTIYARFILAPYTQSGKNNGIFRACRNEGAPAKVSTLVSGNHLPNAVIVLGESSTRANWHLYGYSRQTTPCVDRLCGKDCGGFLFSDIVGVFPTTTAALTYLLTDMRYGKVNDGSWTLAEIYRRAGYRCSLISNQWAGWNKGALLYRIFNGCETRISVPKECNGAKNFDELVIPFLEKEFAQTDVPKLVFIHLKGQHFPVQDIIPETEKHFTDDVEGACLEGLSAEARDRVNRYDDAVLYEDKVLDLIVKTTAKSRRALYVLYISDHGESPSAEHWRQYEDSTVYELPFFVWCSEQYRKKFPAVLEKIKRAQHRPMQSDELTEGILELGLIDGFDGGGGELSVARICRSMPTADKFW